MHRHHHIFLLTCMVTVASRASLAFVIDSTQPDVIVGDQKDFFGYKVLQFNSGTDKGIIVTAPLQRNGSGGICRVNQERKMNCFHPNDISLVDKTIPVEHLGLSIAEDSSRSQFTVCSPSVAHECNNNSYLNSVCYTMTDDLQQISNFTPAFQECTKETVDLVFLFDGSRSMTEKEFSKNKDFIENMMDSLKNTSIKFAAIQFSTDSRIVFDFNDYLAGSALDKLMKEPHMRELTNTHRALQFALDGILENVIAGASPEATKVLVMITDGYPSDTDSYGVIQRYNDKNIIRFVIAVKGVGLDKFHAIASEPTNAFKIEDYNGLKGILKDFQKRIFRIEGTKVARAGELKNELSQSGFSAVYYKDNLILGSVGSNTWRGSLEELHEQKETQIKDPLMEMDSYMGYSASVGENNNVPLYFTGAPRFEHTGQVIMFRHDGNNWTVTQRINGDQIGSYFGAELCSVDVDSDGNTDFLLVGAPLFYQLEEKREGQIYVYTLTDEMQLKSELIVTAPSMGRFGTCISSLVDLNGDGLRDIGVGAPMEDDNRGAVYIFLGDRHRGIRSTFSQRITGAISPGLRFFGQAIDGDIDLGEDELADIVVGSQGKAVVLRSRPVFNVTVHLSFQPEEINTDKIDCPGHRIEYLPMTNLTACFDMVEITKSKSGTLDSGLNISYTLDVDPKRQTHRGFFSQPKERTLTVTYELRDKETCFNYSIYMPMCVIDTLSPISINLTFSQVDSASASAVLNVDSKRHAVVEVPFKRQCRKNDTCIAELEVDLDFTSPILVAEHSYFNMYIKLSNRGDDSYNTSLSIHYPPGLSFASMHLIQATRPHTLHNCEGHEDHFETICWISVPVFRSGSSTTFNTSFQIMTEAEWNDTVSLAVIGRSDNSINITRSNSTMESIPVQFKIKMAITLREETITYLNFTAEDTAPKQIVITYKINNPGWKAFPVNVDLFFPTELEYNFELDNYQVIVQQNKTQCTGIHDVKSEYCSAEKRCKMIKCDSFILDKESATEFKLLGDVQFQGLKEYAKNTPFLQRYTGSGAEVKFESFIRVNYDHQRYALGIKKENSIGGGLWKDNDPSMKVAEIRVEFIIVPDKLLIILTGTSGGLLLLIIITIIMFKLGCFKRKTLKDYQEQEEEAALQTAPPLELSPAPTKDTASQSETDNKSDKLPEEKQLLDDGEANSNLPRADIDGLE